MGARCIALNTGTIATFASNVNRKLVHVRLTQNSAIEPDRASCLLKVL